MIPLQSSLPVRKFPLGTLALVLIFVLTDLASRVWPGARLEFLKSHAFVPADGGSWKLLFSPFFHHHLGALFVSALFAWVFSPRVFERRGLVVGFLIALTAAAVALLSFAKIHSDSMAPVLCPEAVVGGLLGASMRRDIWGTVNTFVIGPGWMRVFEVPSYVLLFFWFFYLLVGNFFVEAPFSDAPMLYWMPFVAFLWGFVVESLIGGLFENRHSTTSENS